MAIMDQITNFLGILKETLGLPVMISNTISEGVSEGISDGISRNKKWIERGAIRFTVLLIGLFFLCWGIAKIGDNAFPQYEGFTAVAIGIIAGVVILMLSNKD
jgi:hypothetical protein